ncbi:MAG: serine/threonine protein kinase [Planctomycetes bacterium]|nr:serine/threonine protein kinase [Planctomycetota bacterium]
MSGNENSTIVDPGGGRRIGPYVVESEIGQGGMGMVFRAHDPNLDRKVAVKVLFPHLARDKEFASRFLREARTAARIEHPNVVSVYAADALEGGESCYLAMQFVDGVVLRQVVALQGALPVEAALWVARDVARALAAAHEKGVIHRDVKPDNVLVDRQGRIRVTDFGLARGVGPGPRITETGTFLGTPEYSAPEQCLSEEIDQRADLYSLGVVLYEMLSGQVPHVAPTPYALFKRIVEDEPLPLRTLHPSIPRNVERLVLESLLAKRPEDRTRDANALIVRLDELLADLGASEKEISDYLAGSVEAVLQAGVSDTAKRETHETLPMGPSTARRAVLPGTASRRAERRRRLVGASLGLAGAIAVVASALFLKIGEGQAAAGEGSAVVTPGQEPRAERPLTFEEWNAKLHYPIRVAVLDMDNRTPKTPAGGCENVEWYRIGLSELLASNLSAWPDLVLVARNHVQEVLAELPEGGRTDRALAARLALDLVVRGSYSVVLDREVHCILSVSTPEGLTLVQEHKSGHPDELFALVEALSADLLAALQQKLGRPGAPASPPTASLSGKTAPGAGAGEEELDEMPEGRLRGAADRPAEDPASELLERRSSVLKDYDDLLASLEKEKRRELEGGEKPNAPERAGGTPAKDEDGLGLETHGEAGKENQEDAPPDLQAKITEEVEKELEEKKGGAQEPQIGMEEEPGQERYLGQERALFGGLTADKGESKKGPVLEALKLYCEAKILLETSDCSRESRIEALRLLRRAVELDPAKEAYFLELERRCGDLTK